MARTALYCQWAWVPNGVRKGLRTIQQGPYSPKTACTARYSVCTLQILFGRTAMVCIHNVVRVGEKGLKDSPEVCRCQENFVEGSDTWFPTLTLCKVPGSGLRTQGGEGMAENDSKTLRELAGS